MALCRVRTDQPDLVSPGSTLPIAELLNQVSAGNGVEIQCIHVVIGDEIRAKPGIVRVQKMLGVRYVDIAVSIVAGMEQKICPRIDADVSDAEKQRAGGLAMPLDAKQLTRSVMVIDDRIKLGETTAVSIARR